MKHVWGSKIKKEQHDDVNMLFENKAKITEERVLTAEQAASGKPELECRQTAVFHKLIEIKTENMYYFDKK